jgi:hypothetical protein
MATPAARVKLQIVRGLYENLVASLPDLEEGEICFAKDYNSLYVVENGALTPTEPNLTIALADYIRTIVGGDQTGEPMGHTNKSQSEMSFNSLTRDFVIQPATNVFEVWCKGIKYTFTGVESVTLPNSSGFYFIYFDQNGELQYRTNYFDWPNDAPTAYVYWNAVTGSAEYFGDERHGIVLDWQTHEYLHRTRGAVIANGFNISNYTINGDGSLDAHAQFDLNGGTFFDEDLQVDIVNSQNPITNTWQQDLSGPARIPVLYLEGVGWVSDTPTDFPLKFGTIHPEYNFYDGEFWSAEEVDANKYLPMFIIATNNLNYPIMAVMGQGQYNNISDAEAINFSDLDLNGFPSTEFRLLYRIIYQVGTYANSIKARIRAVSDIREVRAGSVNLLDSSPLSSLFSKLKSVTIQNPEEGDRFTLFRCSQTLNLESVTAIAKGPDHPEATIEIRYAPDLTDTGTTVIASQTITNVNTGQALQLGNLPIPAGSYLWLNVLSTSGVIDEFNLSLVE